MTDSGHEWLTKRFEENRGHLRGVAYRILGSLAEADDAVQESWLRLSRADTSEVENLRSWLTTVVARICLDMLRSRNARREEPLDGPEGGVRDPVSTSHARSSDPEAESVLADSVGFAMLVVLDRLTPAERIAFVLHDVFDVPFGQIVETVGRSSDAVRQLASRARRRIRGATALPKTEIAEQRFLIDRFLEALRAGDAERLMPLLDPDFEVRADAVTAPAAAPAGIHGAAAWAKQAVKSARGARYARPALVDGGIGVLVAPRGKLFRALRFTFANGRIAGMEVIGDPVRLQQIELGVLSD